MGIFQASAKDLRNPVFWRDVASEMLVVTVLMAIITFVLISNNEKVYPITTTHLGLFAGFLVYLLIEGYGPISGAHMNPAASFSLWVAGKISLARAIAYIIIQTLGAAAGSGLGYILTPSNKRNDFHAFNPAKHDLTNVQGVAIEAVFAFNLIFVALSCHDNQNRPSPAVMPSFPIAFCIGIGIMAAGTHTGGLMNPIVAFGPALLAMDFTNHWVYWLGPFIGGPLAVGVYKLLIFIKIRFEPPTVAAGEEMKAVTSQELYRLLEELQRKIKAIDAEV